MTKKIDETLKKTSIENKKVSLKITKKDNSKKVKKVILETPILEKISVEKSKKTITNIEPEQNVLGSLNAVQNKCKISKKSNTSLKSVTPIPNSQKDSQILDTQQILVKPKRTLKLTIEDTSDVSDEKLEESEKIEIEETASAPSAPKKEVSINQNAAFFYEPTIFEKFNIEVSNADEDTTSSQPQPEVTEKADDNLELNKQEADTISTVSDEYDFISTETPDIYKTTYSFEDNIILDDINTSENNATTNENSAEIEDASSNSVFKKFSYEEETNSENNVVESTSSITILPQADTNKQVIENFDNKENLNNNLEISASSNTFAIPDINETLLNTQEILEPSQDIFTNIITPQSNTNIESTDITIDDVELSDEDIDKELDEVLGIENKKNNDDFSIEEYFGVTVTKNQEDDIEDIEEFIDDEEDSDSTPLPKLKQPNVESFSKLIENFTETISTLSNKISDLEANIAETENNKKMRADNYIESLLNSSIDNIDDLDLDDINLEDIALDDISLDSLNNSEQTIEVEDKEELVEDSEDNQTVENILMHAFDNSKINDQMKQDLLSEVLSSDKIEIPQNNVSSAPIESDVTSDFLKVIDSLSKTISELENTKEVSNNKFDEEIVEEPVEEESLIPVSQNEETEIVTPTTIAPTPENNSEKAINILINKDDIFSISIANETYEIVTDFDGISVLSENIHISTPKNNFYVNIGEKYIEIHKQPDLFVVNTNFEDIEFANAINNVTFAKKKNKIELNIKEAFKISSINNKVELSMLNTSIANLTGSQDSSDSDDSSVCDNKTLVINEETQKVYLPYTIEEVMKKLNNSSDYQSIQDVIEQEYTLPLSTFKMPIISRFKEAYRFMRIKEKSSVYAALDLAVELMFNSNLNPAIIRAAKDLKELNIYLDCLYENELDKFDCFKIIYKVLPKIQ